MNPRDRLQYALYLQRLHELFVIKENIAFQYPNAHYNKAAEQIDKVVDKCLDNNIKAVVDGTHNLETPNLDHVITGALSSQQKMLVKTDDKYIQNAVEQNTKEFTNFIQNRIEKENYSLQAKIQKEYEKKKYQDMSEEQAKKLIRQKFQDSARKRSKNIVKDALHTNQSQISWTYNVNNGMKYKVWMNGQSKSGVRYWHIKSKIQPVEIDDFFDIFGPTGHARMMYPGDLNGGAENVANCKCWLYYTNIAPSNLKKKGTIQINPNVNLENENSTTFSANTEKLGLFTRIREKIRNRIDSNNEDSNSEDSTSVENRSSNTKWDKDPNKTVELEGNIAYGVSEKRSEKNKFGKEMGIKKSELSSDELKFIKLFSDDGFNSLNTYMRNVKGVWNPFERRRLKKYWSKEWDEAMKSNVNYMPMTKAIKVGKKLYKKAKVLEDDLVVVRRQKDPMTDYASNGVYINDGFLSTSISGDIPKYGGYKNFIRIPKGEKILYIECVTSAEFEYEVLLPPGVKLSIIEEINPKLIKWSM